MSRPRTDGSSSPCGFALTATNVRHGIYTLVAYARSTASGLFEQWRVARITVRGLGDPGMTIDRPPTVSSQAQPFLLAGWAIDRDAVTGTGVDAVHVWAVPVDGSAARFVGTATLGGQRDDVAAVFGAQFAASGYNIVVSGLPAGQYSLVAYAHSSVTGTFNQWRVVTVTLF